MKNETMQMIAGLDIGNGYVKAQMKQYGADGSIRVDLPSGVVRTSNLVEDIIPRQPDDAYMGDFENLMDAAISSDAMPHREEGRYLFGRRAIETGETLRQFNISDLKSKCDDPLSVILALGSVAAGALRMYWTEHGELPDTLAIDCVAALALPIEEYMPNRDRYPELLKSSVHTVTVRNFEKPTTVSIHFSAVIPMPEGASAQYAITELGAGFLQGALDEARASGVAIDEGYTGEVLAGVENTIGIDIGEGNVNFPVFANGDVDFVSSRSINKGYGTVLTSVVNEVRNKRGMTFKNRKDLADFMQDKAQTPNKIATRNLLQEYIDEQVRIFTGEVMTEFTTIFSKVGTRTDAIYVYGGGASAVRAALYPQLVEAVTMVGGFALPVVYMDSSYSRDLNRRGLFQVAKVSAERVWG